MVVSKEESLDKHRKNKKNWSGSNKMSSLFSSSLTGIKWLDRAVENFDQVMPILDKMTPIPEDLLFDLAFKEHWRLLQNNKLWYMGKRVTTIKELERKHGRGTSLIRAAGTAKILDTIQEGETLIYCGVEISKKDDSIISQQQENEANVKD